LVLVETPLHGKRKSEVRTCEGDPFGDAYRLSGSQSSALPSLQVHVICGPFPTLDECARFAEDWAEQGNVMTMKRRAALAQRLACQACVPIYVRCSDMAARDERQILLEHGRSDLVALYDRLYKQYCEKRHVIPDYVVTTLQELVS
jgi:hypothetical protein